MIKLEEKKHNLTDKGTYFIKKEEKKRSFICGDVTHSWCAATVVCLVGMVCTDSVKAVISNTAAAS